MADDSAGFGVIFLQNTPRIWGDELAIFYDPVVLETDEKMAADLAGPRYHINRSNLLVLESKADMQKRGQASPDDGDALALTFAYPVAPAEVEEEECVQLR